MVEREPFIFNLKESLVSSNPLFLVTKRKQELGSFATNLEAKELEQAEYKVKSQKGKKKSPCYMHFENILSFDLFF